MIMRSMIIIAIAVMSAMPVMAQRVSVGPQIGFYKARDADHASGLGGLSIRAKLTDGFGIEGSINFRKERYLNGSVEVNSWPVMATGLFYLVPVVYGAVGAGWYNSNIQYNSPGITITSETNQEFGWHFGGGLDLPLGSSTRLIGDIKYVFLNYNFTNYPGSSGVNSNFYVMTAGLLFTL